MTERVFHDYHEARTYSLKVMRAFVRVGNTYVVSDETVKVTFYGPGGGPTLTDCKAKPLGRMTETILIDATPIRYPGRRVAYDCYRFTDGVSPW